MYLTIVACRLEVIVVKQNVGEMWAEIISGDKSCEQIFDPDIVEAVHSRLSHLCSDTEVVYFLIFVPITCFEMLMKVSTNIFNTSYIDEVNA